MYLKFSEKTFRAVFDAVFYESDKDIIANFAKTSENRLILEKAEDFFIMTRELDQKIFDELKEDWKNFHSHLGDLCSQAKRENKDYLILKEENIKYFKPIYDGFRNIELNLLDKKHAHLLYSIIPEHNFDNVFNKEEKSLFLYSYTNFKMSAFFAGVKSPSLVSNGVNMSCLKEWTKNFKEYSKLDEKRSINEMTAFLDDVFYSFTGLKTFMKVVAPFVFEYVKQNGDKKDDYENVSNWCKTIVKRYNNFEQMVFIEEIKKKYVKAEKEQTSLLDFIGKESYSKSLKINKEALWSGFFPGAKKVDIDNFEKEIINFLCDKKNGFENEKISFSLENNSDYIVFKASFESFKDADDDLKKFDAFLKIVIDGLMVETLDGFKSYSKNNILKALDRNLRLENKLLSENILSNHNLDGSNEDPLIFKI